jgi:hypothetical protein
MKAKIGACSNYLAAVLLMIMGVIYLTRSSFMPYHGIALSHEWQDVDPMVRVLILALMRGVSGGLLASSITIIFLQYKFMALKLKWIPKLIIIIGMVLCSTLLYAMLMVKLNTPGHPPLGLILAGAVLLIAGFFLNLNEIKK